MPLASAVAAVVIAAVSATAPNRQPQLAVSGNTVALVFGSGDSVWFARSDDAGRTFAAPALVGRIPKLLLGSHRGPRVAIAGGAIVATAISGDLYAWRSTDGGRSWSKPAVVNDVPLAAEEGLHAEAADASGHIVLAWLDDRTKKGKRLYGAFSDDGGLTWSKDTLLYESPSGTICECCHPSLAALGGGQFAVMWRNAVDGFRDMYVLRVKDGRPYGAPLKAGEGSWKLNACPMDGGGLSAANGRILTAFRRERTLYLAAPGGKESPIAEGKDVALALSAEGPAAIWSNGAEIWWRAGSAPASRLSSNGAFPVISALPDGAFLAAWEETGDSAATIALRRLEWPRGQLR